MATTIGRALVSLSWRVRRFLLAAGALVLFIGGAVASGAQPVLDVRGIDADAVPLSAWFDVLEDPEGSLTIDDVQRPEIAARFTRSDTRSSSLSFGFTKSAYWLRLRLTNSGNRPEDLLLEVAYPRLAYLTYYVPRHGTGTDVVETGYALPLANRPYKHRFFVFPTDLMAGFHVDDSQVVYLRVQSPNLINIPARLWNREAFHQAERIDYMIQSGYLGLAVAMLLFNLFLLMSLRDRSYALYALFIVMSSFSAGTVTGLSLEYLWPDIGLWNQYSFTIAPLAASIAFLQFMREVLKARLSAPKHDVVLRLIMALFVVYCLGLFIDYQFFATAITLSAFVAVFVIMSASVACIRAGQRTAWFFLFAYLPLGLSTFVNVLRLMGVVPLNLITGNADQLGSAGQMLILAFALADRLHILRAEKEAAQTALVDSLRASERELESRVQERTEELAGTVARLEKTQGELVEAEKLASLGALVAGVSHELNTPIGNALVIASTISDESREFGKIIANTNVKRSALDSFVAKSAEMAEALVRSCQRAAALITSFKQVAVDQTSEVRRRFDLRDLIRDNLAALAPSLGHVPWTIALDVPPSIMCDSYPGPLGQALTNLVQNAAVHAFEGRTHGCLQIAASVSGDIVELTVKDDGKGMTPATLSHIFEPFFTTQLGKGGSGLGLAICRNIVAGVLGGALTAESAPGEGTRFVMRFPSVAPATKKQ